MIDDGKWAIRNVAEKMEAEARLCELEDQVENSFINN